MNWIIFFVCFFILCPFSSAQQETLPEKSPVEILQNDNTTQKKFLKLRLIKEKEDKKGTDVRNIYNITVTSQDGSLKAEQPYRVLFFVDDHLEENFGKKSLPFSFKRNFKGFKAGGHTLQIKLEDDNDNVVASETLIVEVTR